MGKAWSVEREQEKESRLESHGEKDPNWAEDAQDHWAGFMGGKDNSVDEIWLVSWETSMVNVYPFDDFCQRQALYDLYIF